MPTGVPEALTDIALDDWLRDKAALRSSVTFVLSGYLCGVYAGAQKPVDLIIADPGRKSAALLGKLASRGLLFLTILDGNELPSTLDASFTRQAVSAKDLKEKLRQREDCFKQPSRRGTAIRDRTKSKVLCVAAGRCMYRGCGADLSAVELSVTDATHGYLAHIVASNPNGPRGNNENSHRLSDDPENIMLLCDEHHRLIDRFEPHQHSVDLLRRMRQEHSDAVKAALSVLAFPEARAFVLVDDLKGQSVPISERSMRHAAAEAGYRLVGSFDNQLHRNQTGRRSTPAHWNEFLDRAGSVINDLVRNPVDRVAVFAICQMPILVLIGRIFGEFGKPLLFQYHRQLGSWSWPRDSDRREQSFDFNRVQVEAVTEVVVSLNLTAQIDAATIPILRQKGGMPHIRLNAARQGPDAISSRAELDDFIKSARELLTYLQDELRVSRIHLFTIAPVSSVMAFGMLLQAGHHSTIVTYDKSMNDQQYQVALIISGIEVTTDVEDPHSISLR